MSDPEEPMRPDLSWIEFDPKCRHQDPDVLKNAVFGIAPPIKQTWLQRLNPFRRKKIGTCTCGTYELCSECQRIYRRTDRAT
jgi:hypothetical protein